MAVAEDFILVEEVQCTLMAQTERGEKVAKDIFREEWVEEDT